MSGQHFGEEVDLAAVNGEIRDDGGVSHAAALVAFTDAAMGSDDAVLVRAREALRAVLSDPAFVDTCATIAAFNIVDRIADASGIPLDEGLRAATADVRETLDLARFASSANTPEA